MILQPSLFDIAPHQTMRQLPPLEEWPWTGSGLQHHDMRSTLGSLPPSLTSARTMDYLLPPSNPRVQLQYSWWERERRRVQIFQERLRRMDVGLIQKNVLRFIALPPYIHSKLAGIRAAISLTIWTLARPGKPPLLWIQHRLNVIGCPGWKRVEESGPTERDTRQLFYSTG